MSIIVDAQFIINKFVLQLHFKLPENGVHKDHAALVFQYNANKVTSDTISYVRIQAKNAYLKSIGQPIGAKWASSAIYLTEDQYKGNAS